MAKQICLYSYKELKNIPLQIIHAKYAPEEITLARLYQRIVKSGMTIEAALNTPLGASKDKKPEYRKVLESQYKELCKKYKNPVAITTYINRLRNGESADKAILKKQEEYKNIKASILDTPQVIVALKKLREEEVKSKYKDFTRKEITASKEDAYIYQFFKIPKSLQRQYGH